MYETEADGVTVFNADVGTGVRDIVELVDAHGEALSDMRDGVTKGEKVITAVVDTRTLRVNDALAQVENVRVPVPETQREPVLDGVEDSRELSDVALDGVTLTE